MNAPRSLQVSPKAFTDLAAYLNESGSSAGIDELASAAISEWVVQARARAQVGAAPKLRGYQWKSLFLPEGSRLRMYFNGKYYYAGVEGDDIIFDGRRVSPAQMANSIAGGTRNAWHELWALLPGEPAWKLASIRRQQARDIDQAIATGAQTVAPGHAAASHPLAGQPAAAPPMPARPVTPPAEALLRRLANLLEEALTARQPTYRRRSDALPHEAFPGVPLPDD